ncbi:hypothetical protein D3C80_423530 [compost metagenome]
MRTADDTGHGACGAAEFTHISGDDVGDGARFGIGLIHGQRVHALTRLGNEEGI